MEPLNQAYYSLPENFHCRLSELYQEALFKSEAALQDLVRRRTGSQDFTLAPNSHIMLKDALKFVIKNTEKHENKLVQYPNSVPLNNPKPPKFSHSNTLSLYTNSKSGSKPYRRILDRKINFVDNRRVNAWRKALNSPDIDEAMVKNTFKGINDLNITAEHHDTLVRFFTRKTTFNYQNHKMYPNQANRPEWAHRLGCWAYEIQLNTFTRKHQNTPL